MFTKSTCGGGKAGNLVGLRLCNLILLSTDHKDEQSYFFEFVLPNLELTRCEF